ncbi:MAG: GNAT family N-acetyltransferase [Rhodoplanes sp.]|uniref:GNAT family N-acetyltransferase n=1 Tax=Rhodoplanes sp. TaxID=1968906 RepID=UPI0017D25A1E|nr:GNAT family N-acetyltransferase [Rhodoplanes sp.]NVO14751.1 GNAT family N-acetyltransferase [Rhodoplanes sp.]
MTVVTVDLTATHVAQRSDPAPAGMPLSRDDTMPGSVDWVEDFATAEPIWRDLAARGAVGTAFQRFDWVAAWQRHVGAPAGLRPLVVIGHDRTGSPAFLWPFVYAPRAVTVARFPGGDHSGLNIGLWRRDAAAAMDAAAVIDILRRTGRRCGIDVFALTRQPPRWRGIANPFASLPAQAAVDDVPGLTFPAGGPEKALEAALTRDMRGRLRGKERKLEKLPGYRYVRVTTPAEADRVLDAFLIQKASHFAAQGIHDVFAEPGVAAFLREGCHIGLADGMPRIELHALEDDDEVIAVMGGVADDHRFSSMFNSYTTSENGRWSPGLVLITHIIRDCAERGLAGFDLGPGAAPYKAFFCREPEGLLDSIVPVSWRGHAAAAVLAATAAAKRRAKESETIKSLVQRLRRGVAAAG